MSSGSTGHDKTIGLIINQSLARVPGLGIGCDGENLRSPNTCFGSGSCGLIALGSGNQSYAWEFTSVNTSTTMRMCDYPQSTYSTVANHRPATNNSRRLSLSVGNGLGSETAPRLVLWRRPPVSAGPVSSALRRSMSATSCEKDRNRTSACAKVVPSSIVILSSLQYYLACQLRN